MVFQFQCLVSVRPCGSCILFGRFKAYQFPLVLENDLFKAWAHEKPWVYSENFSISCIASGTWLFQWKNLVASASTAFWCDKLVSSAIDLFCCCLLCLLMEYVLMSSVHLSTSALLCSRNPCLQLDICTVDYYFTLFCDPTQSCRL